MYEIILPTGIVIATSDNYDEALRIADAFTRKDRVLHTVRKAD